MESLKERFKKYETWTEILKALANPIRLFILEELQKGEKSLSYFKEILEIDISTISRHLSTLKKTGVIESEKKGTQVYFKLKIPCVTNFLICSQDVLKEKVKEQIKFI